MSKFYITYGLGTYQGKNFSSVEADSYGEARAVIHEITNGNFAFCSTEEEFKGQPEKWNLTEIPLQAKEQA